jgi:ABC-2 type transport system permease protein
MALAMAGLGAGLVHGLNTGDVGRELPRVLAGAVIQLPAVWLLAALAVALFGLLPRFAPVVAWAVLAVCLSLGVLGQALTLDQTVLDLSPFTHTPQVPGGVVSATPLIWLVGIATVLTAGGLAGLRRRDIPVG